MMNERELFELASQVASEAEQAAKKGDIREIIAIVKADILTNVGRKISAIAMADLAQAALSGGDMDLSNLSAVTNGPGNIAYQIARAAELIMQKAWGVPS